MPRTDPVEQRLAAAGAYFEKLAGEMRAMAENVRELRRDRDSSMAELVGVELERDSYREQAQDLEDLIEAMRLQIYTPEEVIQRA